MDKIEILKENIRTIDPRFTDELIEALYEYITQKHSHDIINELRNAWRQN